MSESSVSSLPPSATMVSDELRDVVLASLEVVSPAVYVVEDDWRDFARACGVDESATDATSTGSDGAVVVGADVVSLVGACDHVTGELAVITPAAMRRSRWQRGARNRSFGASQKLWRAGWSPVRVDRIRISVVDGQLEMLVAVARRTPPVRVH